MPNLSSLKLVQVMLMIFSSRELMWVIVYIMLKGVGRKLQGGLTGRHGGGGGGVGATLFLPQLDD